VLALLYSGFIPEKASFPKLVMQLFESLFLLFEGKMLSLWRKQGKTKENEEHLCGFWIKN
jgi:hypothetical protein